MLIEDVIGRFAKLPCVDQAQRQRTLLARPQTNFTIQAPRCAIVSEQGTLSGHSHWHWHRHTFIESLVSVTTLLGYDTETRSEPYGQARYPTSLSRGQADDRAANKRKKGKKNVPGQQLKVTRVGSRLSALR